MNTSNNLLTCAPCGPDLYKDLVGLGMVSRGADDLSTSSCSAWEPGKYNPLSDQRSCTECPRNTFSLQTAATSACSDCPANSQSAAGSWTRYNCSCNYGFVSDGGVIFGEDPILFSCLPCGIGVYKDWAAAPVQSQREQCKACPSRSSSLAASTSLLNCSCVPDYTGIHVAACLA